MLGCIDRAQEAIIGSNLGPTPQYSRPKYMLLRCVTENTEKDYRDKNILDSS